MNLAGLTVHEAARLLRERQVSSVELTQAVLDRLNAVEPRVKAYVTVTPEQALQQARAADAIFKQKPEAPPDLLGIPTALKDVLITNGVRTTCSSKILENFVPAFDGTVVAKLREAGGVF
ncbi:MAG TPA: amidase family protein, partial [Chloroflexota bacterium]|nr:amidase family protein [Chloroflexota bacterium]